MTFLLPPYSKYHIIILGSLTLLVSFIFLFLATDFSLPQKNVSESIITPITAEELYADSALKSSLDSAQSGKAGVAWTTDNFVILDIRPEDEYSKLHLSGAQNAPLEFLPASSLNPDVDIVVYSNKKEDLDRAATTLTDKGIRSIYLLHEDLDQLESKGYKLEIGNE